MILRRIALVVFCFGVHKALYMYFLLDNLSLLNLSENNQFFFTAYRHKRRIRQRRKNAGKARLALAFVCSFDYFTNLSCRS